MISLAEAKNYLRVDHCEDDALIQELLLTAKQLCINVGRMSEEELEDNEDTTKTAMLFTVSYLYENRNTADFKKLTLTLRSLLFAQREGII